MISIEYKEADSLTYGQETYFAVAGGDWILTRRSNDMVEKKIEWSGAVLFTVCSDWYDMFLTPDSVFSKGLGRPDLKRALNRMTRISRTR